MRYLTKNEIFKIHAGLLAQTGGLQGIRDIGALESAIAQPTMTFGGHDLYPSLAEKAAALGFSQINNHPFLDGNKRIGHAAMEVFLILNGHEISASIDEQEKTILDVAAGRFSREQFTIWINAHLIPYKKS